MRVIVKIKLFLVKLDLVLKSLTAEHRALVKTGQVSDSTVLGTHTLVSCWWEGEVDKTHSRSGVTALGLTQFLLSRSGLRPKHLRS